MSIKQENEITVRVTCTNDELLELLKSKDFKEKERFALDDYYLIPKNLEIKRLTAREILSKAVIIRHINDNGKRHTKITFKKKNINENGEIISQEQYNCDVLNYKDAIKLFEEIGYYEIMNIKEDDIVFYKDKMEFALKFLKNSNTLIEVETDENYQTIDELKELIKEIEIPIEKDNYFVKKAEDELNRILNR